MQWLLSVFFGAAMLVGGVAHSAVTMRVEARPASAPIGVYVTVTDTNGNAVPGLKAGDFSVAVDGVPVTSPNLSLPISQDPNRHVSVVFAMDYSGSVVDSALAAMQGAVIAFVNSMQPGDYAAIVKFNKSSGASAVQQFTQIDGAAGTQALIDAVNAPYPGTQTNIYDAILVSVGQFTSPPTPLPGGAKAVILVSDGKENSSLADVNTAVTAANEATISVFTVGVGQFTGTLAQTVLRGLANQTSGGFYPAPTDAQISDAYLQVSQLLNNEYLLTFQSSIVDCSSHSLEVQVLGQGSATGTFTRCAPVLVPDVRGRTLAEATTLLTTAGFAVGTVTQQPSTTVPAGLVASQNPSVGANVAQGSKVNLVLSSGPPTPVTVPNVVGQTQSAATTAITGANLVVGTVTQQSSTTVVAGSVISQSPSGGTVTTSGSTVDLVVSSGPPPVTVPNVVGLTQSAAASAIAGASLVVGSVTQQSSSTVAAGNVISQSPSGGASVANGSTVNLVVSSGAPPKKKGGGGGGATGPLEALVCLLLLPLARRRRTLGIRGVPAHDGRADTRSIDAGSSLG